MNDYPSTSINCGTDASDVVSHMIFRQRTVQLGILARFKGAELEGLDKRQIMTATLYLFCLFFMLCVFI